MTAAGSSAADALHKLYDQATYALGYGGDAPSKDSTSSDRYDDAVEGKGTMGAIENKAQQSGRRGPRAAPISGPGNHPDPDRQSSSMQRHDNTSGHAHTEYKPHLSYEEETDTHIDEAGASAGVSSGAAAGTSTNGKSAAAATLAGQQGTPSRPTAPPREDTRSSQQSRMLRISRMMRGGTSPNTEGGSFSAQHETDEASNKNEQQHATSNEEQDAEEGEVGEREVRGVDGVKIANGVPSPSARWSVLRQRLRDSAVKKGRIANERKARVVGQMSVVTELQTGILPVFMLKMTFERDEQGHRRIPVLLNHLRLRISDSVNPLHTSSAVFRIELEYGDGLIRWVCYRSLRDFINLHTHYRAAAIKGYLGRPVGAAEGDVGVPSFPKTSLPYFNQLQRQGWGRSNGDNAKARFAQAQRTSLEDYLVEIIKRTMFRPEANRLCKFFELSSLSVSLASRGGYQGKQGYLRILSRSSRKDAQRGIFSPVNWANSHVPKWFIVRESYIAVVEQPDSLQVFDVFLLDNAFEIIRPKRLYRQTLHLAQELGQGLSEDKEGDSETDITDEGGAQKLKPRNKSNKHVEGRNDEGGKVKGKGKGKDEGEGKPETKLGKYDISEGAKVSQQQPQSAAVAGKDETAILTEGHFRDPTDDEYSGAHRRKRDAKVSSHTFYIKNAEQKLKLVANNERQMNQFIASMERVAHRNIFGKANRFGSFAPIRLNCNAQWLVDGRDYYWQVSRALARAKDRIFIHDWWLSPELYLRRPGAPKYRLDHILKRKAEEGVKVFVIVYNEVSNNFTPTDSNYTKQRLIGLHSNIFVQRSPSHFQTGTFYWAHHEKLCVIDETIAFMGGLDLCFGRWDTSEHVLTDNTLHGSRSAIFGQKHQKKDQQPQPQHDPSLLGPGIKGREFFVWPGQDFANERVMEWHDLTKPEVDLFDRVHFPRMPWHDIGLQLIGQPARDLCRHFVQRWNYLLRIKNHKRLMPFLVPPPDFHIAELQKYDLTGTCEAQICRSAGPWSMGTTSTVEHSIQNAYLKAIQMSEHFVYIENQFFVTSTEARGTVVENRIGDALVSRIVRAAREQTPWRAVIVIPLIPGFPMSIDHPDASSVRLIVDLQYRSICRGEQSIFGKLRRTGIDPAQYISFFSLRQWGRLPSGRLTTEQVYIHAKAMIVDDRLALIGSANINERSQRGDRDSELACVVRDTDMIDSCMAGKPFKVGRFAHTLRVRLMREHLGLDVDAIDEQETAAATKTGEQDESALKSSQILDEQEDGWDPDQEQNAPDHSGYAGKTFVPSRGPMNSFMHTVKESVGSASKGARRETKDKPRSAAERAVFSQVSKKANGSPQSAGDDHLPTTIDNEQGHHRWGISTDDLQNTPTSGPADAAASLSSSPSFASSPPKSGSEVKQPLDERIEDIAKTIAQQHHIQSGKDVGSNNNKEATSGVEKTSEEQTSGEDSRKVAASMTALPGGKDAPNPSFSAQMKNVMSQRMSINPWALPIDPPTIDAEMFADPLDERFYRDIWMASAVHNTQVYRKVFKSVPDDTVTTWSEYKAFMAWHERLARSGGEGQGTAVPPPPPPPPPQRATSEHGSTATATTASVPGPAIDAASADSSSSGEHGGKTLPVRSSHLSHDLMPSTAATTTNSGSKNPTGTAAAIASSIDEGFSSRELEQMEALLGQTRGTLVLFSTRFLEAEDRSDNFLFPMDKINPLNVYD